MEVLGYSLLAASELLAYGTAVRLRARRSAR